MAYFDFAGTVTVEMTYNAGTVNNVKISPRRLNIASNQSGNTFTFELSDPRNLLVYVNDNRFDAALNLFANPIEAAPPLPSEVDYYFGPGLHTIGNGDGSPGNRIELQSGDKVYLAGGAVVKGAIFSAKGLDASNIKIWGRGALWGINMPHDHNNERYRLFQLIGGSNIEVEGITLIDSPHHGFMFSGCHNVTVDNVKDISYNYNSDGINPIAVDGFVLTNSFFRVTDDGIAIKCRKFDAVGDARNIVVSNCVFMNDDWWGNGIEIGAEIASYTVEDVTFKQCDIIYTKGQSAEAAISIDAEKWTAPVGNGIVRNITYDDIHVELIVNSARFILLDAHDGVDIDNILFKNVTYTDNSVNESRIEGSSGSTISNIRFENLKINDVVINSANEANLTFGSNVSDVTFNGDGSGDIPPAANFPDPNKWYSLESKIDGRYVANSGSDDARILTGNSDIGRHVRFQPAGVTNYYNIVSRSDGDYLGNKTENSDAEWWSANNTTFRRWKVQASGTSGYYNIVSEVDGGYLGNKTEENDAQVWSATDTDYRRWKLIEVGQVNARTDQIDTKSLSEEGLPEVKSSLGFYPNPATHQLQVVLPTNEKFTRLLIQDLQGRTVLQKRLRASQSIEVGSLPKGLYLVRLQQGTHQYTEKLLVE